MFTYTFFNDPDTLDKTRKHTCHPVCKGDKAADLNTIQSEAQEHYGGFFPGTVNKEELNKGDSVTNLYTDEVYIIR